MNRPILNMSAYELLEKKKLSFCLALSIHLLLASLFFQLPWQAHKPTPILNIELWPTTPSMTSADAIVIQEKLSEKSDRDIDSPPITPPKEITETVTEPDIALAHKKGSAQKKAAAPKIASPIAHNKKEIKTRLPIEKPATLVKRAAVRTQESIPPLPKEKSSKIKPQISAVPTQKSVQNPIDIDHLFRQDSGVRRAKGKRANPPAMSTSEQSETALTTYLSQLKQIVRENTIYPHNNMLNASAVLKIFVLSDGTIQDVRIIKMQGDPKFAQARRQALILMQRLPPLPTGILFSEHSEWTLYTKLRE